MSLSEKIPTFALFLCTNICSTFKSKKDNEKVSFVYGCCNCRCIRILW